MPKVKPFIRSQEYIKKTKKKWTLLTMVVLCLLLSGIFFNDLKAAISNISERIADSWKAGTNKNIQQARPLDSAIASIPTPTPVTLGSQYLKQEEWDTCRDRVLSSQEPGYFGAGGRGATEQIRSECGPLPVLKTQTGYALLKQHCDYAYHALQACSEQNACDDGANGLSEADKSWVGRTTLLSEKAFDKQKFDELCKQACREKKVPDRESFGKTSCGEELTAMDKGMREKELSEKALQLGFLLYEDVVADTKTGLMWTRDGNIVGEKMTWDAAMNWAKNLNYGGYNDWRLPTKEELETFAKRGGNRPSDGFNANGFSNTQMSNYWSSSSYDSGYAWVVDFYDGSVHDYKKSSTTYVRGVRDKGENAIRNSTDQNQNNVTLNSDPPGSTVTLNKKPVGVTPLSLNLSQGSYGIALEKSGYKTKWVILKVDKETPQTVSYSLESVMEKTDALQPTTNHEKPITLETLSRYKETIGWGDLHINSSVEGRKLNIGGSVFDRGIGTHAPSDLRWKLNKKYRVFHAKVGHDNESSCGDGIKFTVYTSNNGNDSNWELVWTSGIHKQGVGPETVSIDVSEAIALKIYVDKLHAYNCDHADIVDGVLVLK